MCNNLAPETKQKDFIDQLQCREVRMLAQAVFGPALIQILAITASTDQQRVAIAPRAEAAQTANQPVFALNATYKKWLTALDQAPESLIDFLASSQRLKLGVYHERLWQYFLTHSHETELICANLKARHNGQDLGEFDLIYQHHKLGLVHCEIASKYYLADGLNDSAWEHWHGPGKSDRLDVKLHHSINKQLNLADHPAALATLESALTHKQKKLLSKQPLVKHLHVGGRLFYRHSDQSVDRHTPRHLNPHHLKGHWFFLHEWQALLANHRLRFCSVDKPFWLDTLTEQQLWITAANDHNALNQEPPEMVVYQLDDQHPLQYGFVVPNDWLSR